MPLNVSAPHLCHRVSLSALACGSHVRHVGRHRRRRVRRDNYTHARLIGESGYFPNISRARASSGMSLSLTRRLAASLRASRAGWPRSSKSSRAARSSNNGAPWRRARSRAAPNPAARASGSVWVCARARNSLNRAVVTRLAKQHREYGSPAAPWHMLRGRRGFGCSCGGTCPIMLLFNGVGMATGGGLCAEAIATFVCDAHPER